MIIRIELQDFLSFRGQHTITLPGAGLFAVDAENREDAWADSNASGKTNLLQAPGFAYWGQVSAGSVKEAVISRDSGADRCHVTVDTELRGAVLSVTRVRHSSKSKPDELTITLAGKTMQHDTLTDAQAYLNELLGVDWTTYKAAAVFTGDFQGVDVRGALDRLWGLDRFDRAAKVASQAASRMRETHERMGAEVARKLGELTTVQSALMGALQDSEAVTDAHGALVHRLQVLQGELGQVGLSYTAEAADVDDLSYQVQHLNAQLQAAREATPQLEANLTQAVARVKTAEGVTRAMRGVCQETLDTGQCVICHNQAHPTVVMGTMERFTQGQQRLSGQEEEAQRALVDNRQLVAQLTSEAQTLSAQVAWHQANADNLVRQANASKEQWSAVHAELLELGQEGVETGQEVVQLLTQMRDAAAALAQAEEERGQAQVDADILTFLGSTKGLGNQGLKLYIQESRRPDFNKRLGSATEILSDGALPVQLATSSTTKRGLRHRLTITAGGSRGDGSDNMASRSGGERKRMDLPIILAMSDYVSDLGWLVLDEVIERVDETGAQRLLRAVLELSRHRQVFIVTHSQYLRGLLAPVAHRVHVYREAGSSHVAPVEVVGEA